MRHPSENFIKYLMTSGHSQAVNNDWIRLMMSSLGYPIPDSDYLIGLRADLASRTPNDFKRNDKYHRESKRFMKSEGIYNLHYPDKPTKEAQKIVMHLRPREAIESLLLGRVECKDVAKKVNTKFAEYYTAEGIFAYKHYYWNVDLLSVEDWAKLEVEYEASRQNILAIAQIGASMALHKAGFQQQIDSKSMLRSMQETIFFDFQEWKSKPHGRERTNALVNLAKSAVMVDTQLSQADSALKDSLSAFEQFRMETAKHTVKGVKEIAPNGNFTGSGAKLLESPRPEEESK